MCSTIRDMGVENSEKAVDEVYMYFMTDFFAKKYSEQTKFLDILLKKSSIKVGKKTLNLEMYFCFY